MLPPVRWYDFWTGQRVTHGQPPQPLSKTAAKGAEAQAGSTASVSPLQTVNVKPEVDKLPVYVRGGSIIPMEPLVESTEQKPQGPLELRVYPGPDCKGSLYQDDGTTMNYRRGDYLRVDYTCESQANRLQMHIGAQSGTVQPWWSSIQISVYDWPSQSAAVTLNGQPVSKLSYDASQHVLHVEIQQSPAAADLTVTATGH